MSQWGSIRCAVVAIKLLVLALTATAQEEIPNPIYKAQPLTGSHFTTPPVSRLGKLNNLGQVALVTGLYASEEPRVYGRGADGTPDWHAVQLPGQIADINDRGQLAGGYYENYDQGIPEVIYSNLYGYVFTPEHLNGYQGTLAINSGYNTNINKQGQVLGTNVFYYCDGPSSYEPRSDPQAFCVNCSHSGFARKTTGLAISDSGAVMVQQTLSNLDESNCYAGYEELLIGWTLRAQGFAIGAVLLANRIVGRFRAFLEKHSKPQ